MESDYSEEWPHSISEDEQLEHGQTALSDAQQLFIVHLKAHTIHPTITPSTFEPNPFETPKLSHDIPVLSHHRSVELTKKDMKQCFELLKHTSFVHYRGSKQGWDARSKKQEMKDPAMWYILVRLAPKSAASTPIDDPENTNNVEPKPEFSFPALPQTEISGFMSFKVEYDDPPYDDRRVLYIYEVHLADVLRGIGLGKHLFKIAHRIARSMGITKIMLTVFAANLEAFRFYKSLDFSIDTATPPASSGDDAPVANNTRSRKNVQLLPQSPSARGSPAGIDYYIMSKDFETKWEKKTRGRFAEDDE